MACTRVMACRAYLSAAGPLPTSRDTSVTAVARLLAKVLVNAFSVVDAELDCHGIGLYPQASLLNHSCKCAPCTAQMPMCLWFGSSAP
jgi:hypothetical protein